MARPKPKSVEQILDDEVASELLALFNFDLALDTDEEIIEKFNLWGRYSFPKYYKTKDAPFHKKIDAYNMKVYRGTLVSFTDVVFRSGAKTTRTKLFVAFVIANDQNQFRRYFKVLTKDGNNSKQVVTDVYNMFMSPRVKALYPGIFKKTEFKREEAMHVFTTATGVKVIADTVGTDQRGQLQEDARPDFIWFDDFETRITLRSPVITKAIGDNMEEARTGLAAGGGCVYTCNYISERGNVHKLVQKKNERNVVLIVPIKDKYGRPAWWHTIKQIAQIEEDAEDFPGEYLCQPSAGLDVIFNRENLVSMVSIPPKRTIGQSFKVFHTYQPDHRYALGADPAGGVGLDSSASVVIDFDTIPCRVVATYHDNTIKPDAFGVEIISQGERYGECLLAPEANNDMGGTVIQVLKHKEYSNIYERVQDVKKIEKGYKPSIEYGWMTNGDNKNRMMFALRKAVDDGHLTLTDEDLIAEAMSYARDDLMDSTTVDPRLTTRHFDLLMACAIAWQMREHATYEKLQTEEEIDDMRRQDELFDRHAIT